MRDIENLNKSCHPFAKQVCKTLQDHNFEAYLVGGVVRDNLLGKQSSDIDIATNARPDDVFACFDNAIYTGKAYGTVTVPSKGYPEIEAIQITTYRSDGIYSNQRHPDSIEFEDDIHKDLARRDFSINALAYDPISGELIDDYQGLTHLKARLLVTVGDAETRFKEDSLRLLRLCRFAAQLNFDIQQDTKAGFISSCETAVLPAKERMQVELEKLMKGQSPSKGLLLLKASAFSEKLIPGLRHLNDDDIIKLDNFDVVIRWAALIKSLNYDDVIAALLFSNKDQRLIKRLIQYDLDVDKATFNPHDLAVTGQDLQDIGYQGPAIGEAQKLLLDYVLIDLSRNVKQGLLAYLKQLKT